jgi:outer membrane receptor protein involved in Fe transport
VTGSAALLALALDFAAAAPPPTDALAVADRITVTATRTETRLGETAASVVVLSDGELAASAAPALDDALRQVPGFTLFRRAGSRFANPTAQGVTLRGLGGSGASRALVLDDGVPLNDPFGGWVYWGRVPRAALERVEVLRGGASDLYGSAALAGVVQLVRHEPAPQVRLEASYGERGSPESSLFLAGRWGRWGAALAAGAAATDGYVLVDPRQRGSVDTPAGSRHTTADLTLERSIDRSPGTRERLFVRGAIFSEERENGTPLQVNATDIRQVTAGGDLPLAGGLLTARAWAGDQDFEQDFSALEPDRRGERLTRAQVVPADAVGASGQWSWVPAADLTPARESARAEPGPARQAWRAGHTLVVGLEVKQVEGTSHETAFTPAGAVRGSAGGRQRTAALFLEDLLRLGPRLSLSLAVRADGWENDGERRAADGVATPLAAREESAVSPRATLLYRAGERWAWTASAYRGFRAPTLNELYRAFRVGDVVTLANDELAAERLAGAEAGALFGARGGRLTGRGTLFWMEVDDTIANVTLSVEPGLITRRRENLGRSRSRGLELDLAARLGERWHVTGGYLLADAEVRSFPANRALEGLLLPQVPRHQASLQLRFDDPRRLAAGLQARWTGVQFDDDQNRLRLGSFATLDLLVAHPLGRALSVFAAGENLLDERYEIGRTPVRTLGPPRLLRLGVRFARR